MTILKKIPVFCPSCSNLLRAKRFECPRCHTSVDGDFGLPLLAQLPLEDQEFIAKFVKASGSLKNMAREYGVSYPTVRNRLDDLMARIAAIETQPATEENPEPGETK